MNFSCVREKIANAVASAERFTGKNITLPILGNILVEFQNNKLRITATNLEHAIQIDIKGDGEGIGSIAIPAKILNSFLQSLKEDIVYFEGVSGGILIKTKLHETKIHGITTQDFPLIPKVKKVKEFSIPAMEMSLGVQKLLPAVSQSEFKPELCGVLWRVSPTSLRLVATDTFRLAEKTIFYQKKNEWGTFSFILPARSAAEISRVFGGGGDVRVTLDDNQVMFISNDVLVVSRLIEGKFPDYDMIIPKTHEISCRVSRQDIHDSVRASSIFASKIQDVSISFQEKYMEISSANQEVGEYKTKTYADTQGNNIKMSFNYKYVLDGLNMLHEDEIFFGCNTEQSPVILRNTSDGSFVYVLMPIRAI